MWIFCSGIRKRNPKHRNSINKGKSKPAWLLKRKGKKFRGTEAFEFGVQELEVHWQR